MAPHTHTYTGSNNTLYEGIMDVRDDVEVRRSRFPPGRLDLSSEITFHSSRLRLLLLPVREEKQSKAGIHPGHTKEV